MPGKISDYALIGDCRTAALIGLDGSIDWLCLDCFDAPACFAALLGDENNGSWKIAPSGDVVSTQRRYRKDTLILETDFETATGKVRVTDHMPLDEPHSSVVRVVTGLSGSVEMESDLVVRFDYGRLIPWVSHHEDGTLTAVAGPHMLALRTPAGVHGEHFSTVSNFNVSEGDSIPFVLTYGRSYDPKPEPVDVIAVTRKTEAIWTEWASHCTYEGPYRDTVMRSLITLKALTYAPTGGIVAAATTSLPEEPGGERNWDYRFCWLRDATFTLLTLLKSGYQQEADDWRHWLIRAVAGTGSQVQPLYTIRGESRVEELELPWLKGFGGAKPVRIGNDAFGHLQLDIFGEVLDALHQARRRSLVATEPSWDVQLELLSYLETVMNDPDHGIWETRGPKQHFTYSKVMIWVAFDRAVAAVRDFGFDGPIDKWRDIRDRLHEEICEKAFDPELNAFVQAYGSKDIDASCLLLPQVGFLPATDERIIGTMEMIRDRLMIDGLIYRYNTATGADGLPPGEGSFLACSFWYADNLILQGKREEGREMFERLLGLCNDVGLLAEEYDGAKELQLGNFPQALSHLALVGTAHNLIDSHGPAQERSRRPNRKKQAK